LRPVEKLPIHTGRQLPGCGLFWAGRRGGIHFTNEHPNADCWSGRQENASETRHTYPQRCRDVHVRYYSTKKSIITVKIRSKFNSHFLLGSLHHLIPLSRGRGISATGTRRRRWSDAAEGRGDVCNAAVCGRWWSRQPPGWRHGPVVQTARRRTMSEPERHCPDRLTEYYRRHASHRPHWLKWDASKFNITPENCPFSSTIINPTSSRNIVWDTKKFPEKCLKVILTAYYQNQFGQSALI